MDNLPDKTTEQQNQITETKPEKHWLFPKGNSLYNLRTKSGVAKLFETPEIFLCEVSKYIQWANENPWIKKEQLKTPPRAAKDEDGNTYFPPNIIEIPTERPLSIEGLCNYLGITLQTFLNYESKESYKDFFEVVSYVRKLIETNQFEGGMVGAFNPAIVIRKLGLKEQIESKVEQTYPTIVFQTRNVEDVQAEVMPNDSQSLPDSL